MLFEQKGYEGTTEPESENEKSKTGLDEACINTIRFLSVDAVQEAQSGHPGLPMGAAPMAYVLWTRFLRHNPSNPSWFDRDRFVLSAGHGSMLLYSLLYLTGYQVSIDQIKQFRKWGSITPGHPEYGMTPGVEASTGPLGQGFGNGIGMAIAEAHLAVRYNTHEVEIINHYTYGIVSDGDLMEGVASESASLAGHLRLGKIIYLYDMNQITLSASTNLTFTEDVRKRFEAYRWHTETVNDGNDINSIEECIRKAKEEKDRPSLIMIRTHLGYGSPHKQDTFSAHGAPLGPEEVRLTKERLSWPIEPLYYVPEESLKFFRKALENGKRLEEAWSQKWTKFEEDNPGKARELKSLIERKRPVESLTDMPKFSADPKGIATRVASGKILQLMNEKVPNLIGGSADLNESTFTELKGAGSFENPETWVKEVQGAAMGGWDYKGKNIYFGVREHAMGTLINGIALHGGLIPFGATFLTFSDYMKPSMRLAALMGLKLIYVFTHDSIGLGEDGPTHQPIEQLATLRAIPGLIVIRPGDANETREAWKSALQIENKPVALILSRQNLPVLDREAYAGAEGLFRGGYILLEAPDLSPELILIASGSEISLIVAAHESLREQRIRIRLVSMPSWELFELQSKEYQDLVLPPSVRKRLVVEAGVSQGWEKYAGSEGKVISMERYGASASGQKVMQEFGFNVENVCRHILDLMEKK